MRFANTYAANRVTVALSNQVASPIHYTLNGNDPVVASALYRDPLQLPVPSTLRAATFVDGHRVGDVQTRELTRANLLRRSGAALKQCSGKLTLRLEDDAPAAGPRAFFDVDLFDPCWIFERAPLDGVTGIAVAVGQLPYNFQLQKDAANIVPRPAPQSAAGELKVSIDSCTGAMLATLPLAPALGNPAVTTLEAALPAQTGTHDLCFMFGRRGND